MSTNGNNDPDPLDQLPGGPAPTALTPRTWKLHWQSAFLIALSRMPNVSAACRSAGVALSTVYEQREREPAFREAWEEARKIAVEVLEGIAYRRATVGEPKRVTRHRVKRDAAGTLLEEETVEEESVFISNALLITLLKAHRPELYRERYEVRHQGPEGGPIQVEVYRQPDRDRLRELARLALELEEGTVDGEVVSEDDDDAEAGMNGNQGGA